MNSKFFFYNYSSFPLMNEESYAKKWIMKQLYENDSLTKIKWTIFGLPIFLGDIIRKKIINE